MITIYIYGDIAMKDSFKVVVAGGRDFKCYKTLSSYLDKVLSNKVKTHNIVVVCGKARGADTLGEKYARERGYEVDYYVPNWDEYGKSAGYKRNEVMANNSHATVAFWDGKSRGTKHMINLTKTYGNLLKVCPY